MKFGYEAKTYYELAEIFSEALGQAFSYEPQPPVVVLNEKAFHDVLTEVG